MSDAVLDPPVHPAPAPDPPKLLPKAAVPPPPGGFGKLALWLQYAYFLRFALLLWLWLPLLVLLDSTGISPAFTRAILTLESASQVLLATFFILSANLVALIIARVVSINGGQRFAVEPPAGITKFFGRDSAGHTLLTLLLPLALSLLTLGYIGGLSLRQQTFWEPGSRQAIWLFDHLGLHGARQAIWLFELLGLALTLAFWYLLFLLYYWIYDEDLAKKQDPTRTDLNPRPLLFPCSWSGDLLSIQRPVIARRLEFVFSWQLPAGYQGYAPGPHCLLWELHFFSLVALLGVVFLYLSLYPIIAPIQLPYAVLWHWIFTGIPALIFFAGICTAKVRRSDDSLSPWAVTTKALFLLLSATVLTFVAIRTVHPGAAGQPFLYAERAMPTLASLTVFAIALLWSSAALAFFLDRYRLPVLTVLVALLFLPKLFPFSLEEHYFPAKRLAPGASVHAPIPADILSGRRLHDGDPLIIVTSTGGGIHAAAWTAAILGQLETEFAAQPSPNPPNLPPYLFHQHLLLVSGVSGGSVGLMPFLLEYTADQPFQKPEDSRRRIVAAAQCSSLEAVSWGLIYGDLQNAVSSFLPLPSPGVQPADDTSIPRGHDRSWALEQAFNRNLSNGHCGNASLNTSSLHMLNGNLFTLSRGVAMLQKPETHFPAFTFNTTTVETGSRFLLGNYKVPDPGGRGLDELPAESFLHAYAEIPADSTASSHDAYADLSLATAARLSATFPVVSSASRLPTAFAHHAFHFVDGGYFDNDGTASVIEFLHSAMILPDAANKPNAPIHILLIEIRNGPDLDSSSNGDSFARQDGIGDEEPPKPFRLTQELMAPLDAMWLAGHESVTRRNRRELCLLEEAEQGRLDIHHVVFDYRNPEDGHQPLNWALTRHQQKLIEDEANESNVHGLITSTQRWIAKVQSGQSTEADAKADLCTSTNRQTRTAPAPAVAASAASPTK